MFIFRCGKFLLASFVEMQGSPRYENPQFYELVH